LKKRIKIFTGKIHSGKTTKLFNYINSLNSVDGILAPIVNDKRMLFHISTKTMKEFEVDNGNANTINIGQYYFLEKSFIWANEKLIESYLKNPDLLIIDEIGKLELMHKGLYKSFKFILDDKNNFNTKIIIVARESLLKELIEFYNLNEDDYDFILI